MRDWWISDERWFNSDKWLDRRFQIGYTVGVLLIPGAALVVGIGIGVALCVCYA